MVKGAFLPTAQQRRRRLVIMAKAPIMGRAKTRLAADIGQVHALRLYRAMLGGLLRRMQSPKWDVIIAVDPPQSLRYEPLWREHKTYPQMSGSLTPRLYQALSFPGPTLVIGTDCPGLGRKHIQIAFKALRRCPAVFGPAQDGGFYLMGINGPAPMGLFDAVRWSSAETLSDVKKNITRLYGAKFYHASRPSRTPALQLPTLIDIDDGASLRAYRRTAAKKKYLV